MKILAWIIVTPFGLVMIGCFLEFCYNFIVDHDYIEVIKRVIWWLYVFAVAFSAAYLFNS